MSDSEYRTLLFAKIKKNTTSITPDAVLCTTREILSLMYADGETIQILISEDGNASFTITIGRDIDGSDQAFIADLDIIPRPIGVKITYVYVNL